MCENEHIIKSPLPPFSKGGLRGICSEAIETDFVMHNKK
jgi:hypothetical protein